MAYYVCQLMIFETAREHRQTETQQAARVQANRLVSVSPWQTRTRQAGRFQSKNRKETAMTLNQIKQAAEIAKSRTSDKRWLAAIDKAVAGVESGWWVVTELQTCLAITTECGATYFANGECQCEAFKHSTACKHRALYRLYAIAAEIEETAPAHRVPGEASLAEYESLPQIFCRPDETAPTTTYRPPTSAIALEMPQDVVVPLAADVAASPRKNLIIEIENIWNRTQTTPLAVELMARFKCNKLEFLDDDQLRRVRLAIAV
jgi:hypothetical protein